MQHEVNFVPVGELIGDCLVAFRIAGEETVQRFIGKDHAEAESHVRRFALIDHYLVVWKSFLS